jgi:hypothetical protein
MLRRETRLDVVSQRVTAHGDVTERAIWSVSVSTRAASLFFPWVTVLSEVLQISPACVWVFVVSTILMAPRPKDVLA